MQKNSIENNLQRKYRDDLPPIPERMKKLPVERGFPVPWFVVFVDGHYDFRVVDARKVPLAVNKHLCWICGERLGTALVFAIGPMCAVNRISSEPPSHRECAEFAAKACPFLIQKQSHRRKDNLPEGTTAAAGISIERQPGVVLLYITKTYKPVKAGGGVLFQLGEPIQTLWFREAREAKREEILHSIETGLPILREAARADGRLAEQELENQITRAMKLIPVDGPKTNLFASRARR